jgi:hypothetical protein
MTDKRDAPGDDDIPDDKTVNEEQLGNPEPAKAHWPEDLSREATPEENSDTYDKRKTAAGAAPETAPVQGREVLRTKG